MGFILSNQPISQIPSGNRPISRPTGQQARRPGKTANPAGVPFELGNFLPLDNIEDLDLPECISNGNLVILTKGNRTQVVIDLRGLVEFAHL